MFKNYEYDRRRFQYERGFNSRYGAPTHTYIYIYLSIYTQTHAHTHTRTRVHTKTHTHTYIYIYIYIHTYATAREASGRRPTVNHRARLLDVSERRDGRSRGAGGRERSCLAPQHVCLLHRQHPLARNCTQNLTLNLQLER